MTHAAILSPDWAQMLWSRPRNKCEGSKRSRRSSSSTQVAANTHTVTVIAGGRYTVHVPTCPPGTQGNASSAAATLAPRTTFPNPRGVTPSAQLQARAALLGKEKPLWTDAAPPHCWLGGAFFRYQSFGPGGKEPLGGRWGKLGWVCYTRPGTSLLSLLSDFFCQGKSNFKGAAAFKSAEFAAATG